MSAAAKTRETLRVGVVGLGVIGRQVCRAVDAGMAGVVLAGATTRRRDAAEAFLATLKSPVPSTRSTTSWGSSDLVVEASTQTTSPRSRRRRSAPDETGGALVCGLLGATTGWRWRSATAPDLVPSGAIAGLDGVKGGAIAP